MLKPQGYYIIEDICVKEISAYENALKIKPDDLYSKNRINEISKLTSPK